MSSDYDPFGSFDDNRELHHRINQALAEAGVRVTMPEEWAPVDSMAADISKADSTYIGELDADPDAQLLAMEPVENYRLDSGFGLRGCTTIFAEHDGLQYDSSNPHTMNRLYGILAGHPTMPSPLSASYTWKDVAHQHLRNYTICDVHISTLCLGRCATKRIAIKRGEFVCIFAICDGCLQWFTLPHDERRKLQSRSLTRRLDMRE